MMINALEASKAEDVIRLESRIIDGRIRISISNPAFIIPEISTQIFQRAFSTKGAGRGQGTYSMKILSRRYLEGDIDFIIRKFV